MWLLLRWKSIHFRCLLELRKSVWFENFDWSFDFDYNIVACQNKFSNIKRNFLCGKIKSLLTFATYFSSVLQIQIIIAFISLFPWFFGEQFWAFRFYWNCNFIDVFHHKHKVFHCIEQKKLSSNSHFKNFQEWKRTIPLKWIERVPRYHWNFDYSCSSKETFNGCAKNEGKVDGKIVFVKVVKLSRGSFSSIFILSCRSSFQTSNAHIINHTQRICYSQWVIGGVFSSQLN